MGLRWASSITESAVIVHAEMFANANRDRKVQPEPIRFPSPLPEREDETQATDEEVEQARAVLKKYTMFAE
ncbi:hypothetical protein [Microbacterium saperdae]|uniref:Uncharacterized protein n=1 Tax=Microbacterium saperdae TaxID=69368 RepID=A0A543BQW6_9MICO|nr:hypothetical protein [Microbacterium saperdae]TQL87207.1 hypothetical protein FB560_2874 [Microbacterium saperdae]